MLVNIIIFLIIALVIGAALAGGALMFGARAVKRGADKRLELVPGVPSQAPTSWAGSHAVEAKLHRRLVAATSSLRRTGDLDPTLAPSVSNVANEAVRLEAELVNAAAMAEPLRGKVVTQLTEAVEAIEGVVERAVLDRTNSGPNAVARELEAFDDRIAAIRQAWTEIDDLDAVERERPRSEPGEGAGY